MTLFEKLAHLIGDRQVPIPAIPGISIPRVSFGSGQTVKVIVFTVLVSVAAVGTGMYFTIKDVANASWNWPDSGAAYYADDAGLGKMGEKLPLNADGTESQTLEIRMAANSRMDALTATLEMGKASVDCIAIERVSGTSGYLWVDTFTLDNLVAPTLSLNASYIHQMTLSGFVDGHHVGPTQNSAGAPDITVESTRGAGTYTATGTVDRLLITLAGDAYVRLVNITGHCSTGPIDLDFIKAGQFVLSNAMIGDDGDINTVAVDIASDTVVHSLTDSFVDRSIVVK
jgi:hypothetical protein